MHMITRIATFISGAATIAILSGATLAQAISPPPQPVTTVTASARTDDLPPLLQAIQQSADPSAAVSAYANAFAEDHSNVKVQEVFVDKMVELGLPELAFHQAEGVTSMDPADGTAWGVLAFVNARRNLMPEALSAIVQAVDRSPSAPFVQRTAGELLAWYDHGSAGVKGIDPLKAPLEKVRTALSGQAQFTDAYNQAKAVLDKQPAAGAESPQPPLATAQPPTPPSEAAPSAEVDGGAYAAYPPVETNIYVADSGYVDQTPWLTAEPAYYPADYGDVWSPWWYPCGTFWGPSFFFGGSLAFFDFDDFHHFGHFHHFGDWGSGHGNHGNWGSWNHGAVAGAGARSGLTAGAARANSLASGWAHAGSTARTAGSSALMARTAAGPITGGSLQAREAGRGAMASSGWARTAGTARPELNASQVRGGAVSNMTARPNFTSSAFRSAPSVRSVNPGASWNGGRVGGNASAFRSAPSFRSAPAVRSAPTFRSAPSVRSAPSFRGGGSSGGFHVGGGGFHGGGGGFHGGGGGHGGGHR
jgi:hypothetical protein